MEKPTAFVIEDDINLAMAFAEAVRNAEYEVEVIHDGRIAKSRLSEITPSLVVLDLHIPNAGKTELLDLMRNIPRFANTRIIVASADALSAEELSNSADLVLVKPIGYKQLMDLASRLKP